MAVHWNGAQNTPRMTVMIRSMCGYGMVKIDKNLIELPERIHSQARVFDAQRDSPLFHGR
jgi:hypothetical protein